MDGGAWQCKYINVNIQAYNDTKNKVEMKTTHNYRKQLLQWTIYNSERAEGKTVRI